MKTDRRLLAPVTATSLLALGLLPASTQAQVTEIVVAIPGDYRVAGMHYEDGLFWVGDSNFGYSGLPSYIHLIDSSTGVEVSSIESAVATRTNARDLVIVGDHIYQAEDLHGNHHVHKMLKADGSPVATIGHSGTYPSGIAADGTYLYVVDTEGRWIQKRRLSDYVVIDQFPLSSSFNFNGATYAHGYLWITRHPRGGGTHDIVKVDPETGAIVEALDLPDFVIPYAFDLAYDGEYFWFLILQEAKIVRGPARWGSTAATFGCGGFRPPMMNYPVTVRGNRALPLKAELFDGDGVEITDLDLAIPPVFQVWFDSGVIGAVDVTGEALPVGFGDEGNQFVYTDDGVWRFNLKTINYSSAGTYTVLMDSGDSSEYEIDPTCVTEFIIE